jgi:ABC-type transport system involved in cytochrome bd biosynthesis fused ATPase/permease subunit
MSSTVKENIVFESTFNEEKFNKVIYHASLEQDLKILPFGVETEIGEKGINISGGQKTRIALARALYSDRDIYLLDDVLSAVDVHVGEFLMRETLKGYLKGKTIIMPTHALKFAEVVDEIIVM